MAKNLASSSQGIDRSRIAGIPGCYDSVATNVPVMDETVLSTSDVGWGCGGRTAAATLRSVASSLSIFVVLHDGGGPLDHDLKHLCYQGLSLLSLCRNLPLA